MLRSLSLTPGNTISIRIGITNFGIGRIKASSITIHSLIPYTLASSVFCISGGKKSSGNFGDEGNCAGALARESTKLESIYCNKGIFCLSSRNGVQ